MTVVTTFITLTFIRILTFAKKFLRTTIIDRKTAFQGPFIKLKQKKMSDNPWEKPSMMMYFFAIEYLDCSKCIFFFHEKNKCYAFTLSRYPIFDNRDSKSS